MRNRMEIKSSDVATPEIIRAELDRVVKSTEFNKSRRLQRFLTFVVEETLAGRGPALKEYTIAVEVFERDSSYDSQTNALVRVEASRLRSKLEKFNAIDGRDDPLHINLPVGSYVPTFASVAGRVSPNNERRGSAISQHLISARTAVAAVAAFAAVGFFTLTFIVLTDRRQAIESPSPVIEKSLPYVIAVLPLRNLSGNPDEDYLSDGMTDAIITSLAKQPSVRVISFTSTKVFKEATRPIAEIARELNVSHVVEGAILRSGARVRITAQLVEARTGRHVWAESYEREMANILTMQDDVSRRIGTSLSENVSVGAAAGANKPAPVDPEAYEAYLKGRYFRNETTEDGLRRGITYFKNAIEKAPKYAAAYSGMAACYCLLGGHGLELVDPREGMPAAKEAVLQSLKLDDSLAEAHAFLGIIRLKYEWDWPGAEEAFRRAIRLNPSYAQARVFYSFFLEAMNRQEEAIREAKEARALDPLSLNINVNLGWQYLRAGQLEQAQHQFEKTRELRANFWGSHWGLGHYHRQRKAYDKAIKAFEQAVEVGGGHALPITDLGYTYAVAGRSIEARGMLDRLKAMAVKNYVSPYNMATIHVGLGEVDEAFAWLEKAFETRSRSLAWLKVASEYDGLRSDNRFKSLLKRIGLPE